jgi:hypothetical protein
MEAAPNFFIVGAPKAGTTSLYYYLDQHPQIYMSSIKEPCYFADEFRFENLSEERQQHVAREKDEIADYLHGPMSPKRTTGMVYQWDDYLKLFQNAGSRTAIGEASVCYLWSKSAARNIASKFPDARIIMMLRDPAERAFSAYLHVVTLQMLRLSFREYVDQGLNCTSSRIGMFHPFLEFGMYCEQVERYFECFPKERIGIYFHEDFASNPQALLADIFRFLGVDDRYEPQTSQRYTQPRIPRFLGASRLLKESGAWEAAKNLIPPDFLRPLKSAFFRPRGSLALLPADRAYLIDHYREDVQNLSTLLEKDLSAWLEKDRR